MGSRRCQTYCGAYRLPAKPIRRPSRLHEGPRPLQPVQRRRLAQVGPENADPWQAASGIRNTLP